MTRTGKAQGVVGVVAGGLFASLSFDVTGAATPTLFGIAALALAWLVAAGREPRRHHVAAAGFAGATRLMAKRMMDMVNGRPKP